MDKADRIRVLKDKLGGLSLDRVLTDDFIAGITEHHSETDIGELCDLLRANTWGKHPKFPSSSLAPLKRTDDKISSEDFVRAAALTDSRITIPRKEREITKLELEQRTRRSLKCDCNKGWDVVMYSDDINYEFGLAGPWSRKTVKCRACSLEYEPEELAGYDIYAYVGSSADRRITPRKIFLATTVTNRNDLTPAPAEMAEYMPRAYDKEQEEHMKKEHGEARKQLEERLRGARISEIFDYWGIVLDIKKNKLSDDEVGALCKSAIEIQQHEVAETGRDRPVQTWDFKVALKAIRGKKSSGEAGE